MREREVTVPVLDNGPSGSFGYEPREKPRWRGKGPWHGALCPNEDCGGTQTLVRDSGRDDDDRILRHRWCEDCGTKFVTVEQVVVAMTPEGKPDGLAKFSEVDVENLQRRRDWKRRQLGTKPEAIQKWATQRRLRARPRHISGSLSIRRGRGTQ